MLDLVSNVPSPTSHFLNGYASLPVTTSLMPRSVKSAKFCSSNGRMRIRIRPDSSVLLFCTRNYPSLHAQWPRDKRSCKTTPPTILTTAPHHRHTVVLVLPPVSIRRVHRTVLWLSRRPRPALHPSSLRADTRTEAIRPSTSTKRETT